VTVIKKQIAYGRQTVIHIQYGNQRHRFKLERGEGGGKEQSSVAMCSGFLMLQGVTGSTGCYDN
jgi:hypothetical protein